jgi:hypothetical protein
MGASRYSVCEFRVSICVGDVGIDESCWGLVGIGAIGVDFGVWVGEKLDSEGCGVF